MSVVGVNPFAAGAAEDENEELDFSVELAVDPRLKELEHQIEIGDELIGDALLEIDSMRLYRAEFPSFAEYLSARWGMKESTAYDHIAAARVRNKVHPNVLGRSQLVAIAVLDEEQWEDAARACVGLGVRETKEKVAALRRKKGKPARRTTVARVPRLLKAVSKVAHVLDGLTEENLDDDLNAEQKSELGMMLAAIRGTIERLEAVSQS